MLDVAISYNRYMFLGHEHLTWLWFAIEKGQDDIKKLDIPDDIRHKVPGGEALLNELCTFCTNVAVIRSSGHRLKPLAIRPVKRPDRCLYCENER